MLQIKFYIFKAQIHLYITKSYDTIYEFNHFLNTNNPIKFDFLELNWKLCVEYTKQYQEAKEQRKTYFY